MRPLTQHGPGDSMKDWVTNFSIWIDFEVLTSTKTGVCEIPPLLLPQEQTSKHISEYNSAPIILVINKLDMGREDSHTKKPVLQNLEFLILRRGKKGKR